jgi:gluconate 2-dehydrogenase gamma chain
MSAADILPVLVAIADRLVPADAHGPGAKEAGAAPYFEWVLADPRMKSIKSMITRGAVWVNGAARKENNVAFFDLEPARQDELLTRLADNKVRPKGFTPNAFMRVMLALTLEAFLGDPKYGGNKGEVGWKLVGGVDWSGRKGGGQK